MTNKQFYDKIATEILTKCHDEADYIEKYKQIVDFNKSHDVKREDMYEYFDSGAAEVLGIATQRYRDGGGLE